MKTKIFISSLLLTIATACNNQPQAPQASSNQARPKAQNIDFIQAHGYFVKNTVKNLPNPKIENAQQFEAIFGSAATQGPGGKPTTIDFTKSYAVAIVLPETNMATEIKIMAIERQTAEKITVKYQVICGQKQSFSIVPHFILSLDKKELGQVVLEEVKG